jgi:hypothetical protein
MKIAAVVRQLKSVAENPRNNIVDDNRWTGAHTANNNDTVGVGRGAIP